MKGCMDYTEEARGWVKPPQKKSKRRRLLTAAVLIGVVALVAINLWPRQAEESFAVATVKEQEDSSIAGIETEQSKEVISGKEESVEKRILIVYVTGAVLDPGVYELEEGDRINDIINLAGGLAEGSAENYINLAAVLKDGSHIHIPFQSEIESGEAALIAANGALGSPEMKNTVAIGPEESTKLVNINTATVAELETLPGIGPTIAQRIVDYREKYGAFKSVEGLRNVSGIGDKKFEDLVDRVCL